jgi:hypothetical protein
MSAKSDWKNKASANRKAVLVALNKGLASPIESGPMIKLFNQIHSDCAVGLAQLRVAQDYADGGYRTQLENSPEMYGIKTRGFEEIYRLHSPTGACDAEMDVTDRALCQAIGRNDSPDKPLPV